MVEKTKTMDFERIELSFKRLSAFDENGDEFIIRNKNLMRNTITIDKENGVQFKDEIENRPKKEWHKSK